MDTTSKLIQYIREELLGGQEVSAEQDLLSDGMIDSIGMVRLVTFLDEEFNVSVPPEDFTIENFGSVSNIDGYLRSKLGCEQR